MEKNKINFYDLEVEIEIDQTTSVEYQEELKSFSKKVEQYFLPGDKEKLLDELLDFKNKNSFKEKAILKFYPLLEKNDTIFNEKVIDKAYIQQLELFMKTFKNETLKINNNEIEYRIGCVGIFKGVTKNPNFNGEYSLNVINTKIITSETNITGLKIILSSRKEIANSLLQNLRLKNVLFTKEEEEAIKQQIFNPISGTKYNGINKLRLSLESVKKGYKDPRWITFKQAQGNGWTIKKGEKGTLCEKIVFHREENGKKIPLEKPFLAYYTLFNAEQIDGIEIFESKDKKINSGETINNILNNLDIKVKESDYNQFYYNHKDKTINIPKTDKNNSMAILEEIIHSTDYFKSNELNSRENNFKEALSKEYLTTKLATLFLQSELDINVVGNNNINNEYIKELLEKDYNNLFRACYKAEKTTKFISDNSSYVEKKNNNLTIIFHNSDINLNLKEDTILYEEKALDFLEKINNLKEGKIKISINLGDFQYKNLNIDFSSNDLGNSSNISDKLNYRFNTYLDFLKEKFINSNNTSKEEIIKYFKSPLTKEQIKDKLILTKEKINNFSINLKQKQNLLLNEKSRKRETRSRGRGMER